MIERGSLSKLGRPSPRSLLRRFRAEFSNWFVLGPLAWVVLPSRFPPRRGIDGLAGRSVTVRFRGGGRAECRIDELFSFVEVFVLREYELAATEWRELRTIVDVGANVGAATIWFANRSPQAAIVAVEPSSSASASLARNLQLNHLENRVRVVRAAVADATGSVYLDERGSSVFARTSTVRTADSERVRALSLPDLLNELELPEVDLLKLDCEGAEFDILLSSDDAVLHRIGRMVGEYHGSGDAVQGLTSRLQDAGFTVWSSGNGSLGLFSAVRR